MYLKGKMYMSYADFKRKYPFATKNYPDTTSLPFNSDKFIGSMTKTKQVKKGGRWIDTEEKTKSITTQFYMNTLEAIPFFRNMGSETVYKAYTTMGYIPYKIISTSPAKDERYIYEFCF